MPRLSLKRSLLCLMTLVGASLMLKLMFSETPTERSQLSLPQEAGMGQKDQHAKDFEASAAAVGAAAEATEDFPRLWFMKGGWVRPKPASLDRSTGRRLARLFPHEDEDSDRIVDQLMFVPPSTFHPERDDGQQHASTNSSNSALQKPKLKKILLFNSIVNWKPLKPGRESFLSDRCPVDTCEVVTDRTEIGAADAILFRDYVGHDLPAEFLPEKRPPHQVWILYLLECPFHTQSFFPLRKDLFNWTATYRHDSDIVAPYEKFVSYDYHSPFSAKGRHRHKHPRLSRQLPSVVEGSGRGGLPLKNYAANKTRKVAWFVSNCAAQNERKEYAEELGRHIQVDVYGGCGKHQCPRTSPDRCFDLLKKEYKFYLAFENSNCRDYITEKFYVNGLGNDVIPIVMGARREDYARSAPPHSYIHVEDFDSPEKLAEYLHVLDKDDALYNEYFRWKGSGEFINTYFWCRLCAMLHDPHAPPKTYRDINKWWRGKGTCVTKSWDN